MGRRSAEPDGAIRNGLRLESDSMGKISLGYVSGEEFDRIVGPYRMANPVFSGQLTPVP